MVAHCFSESEISTEMRDTADKYIKAVLINAKRSYYRALSKIERDGISLYELDRFESNLMDKEKAFDQIDVECFWLDSESFVFEKSDLTEALCSLTRLQLEILLKSVLTDQSQSEIAEHYGISTRMVRKHKMIAIEKLRRRLSDDG